ncbi:MAG: RNA polymerase sigma factor [Pirellula sp.]
MRHDGPTDPGPIEPTSTTERGDAANQSANDHGELRQILRSLPVSIPPHLQAKVDKSDIVQDVLLKISSNDYGLDTMQPPNRKAFLKRMLDSRMADLIRRGFSLRRDARREQTFAGDVRGDDSSPSSQVQKAESRDRVNAAMERLPAHYRDVLLLRQRDDLSFAEIGKVMGISPDAARDLWGRALIRISKIMKNESAG